MLPDFHPFTVAFIAGAAIEAILDTPIHELGHAITAKLAGCQVAACGVGSGDVQFQVRIGETVYFIGRRQTLGGVTLITGPKYRTNRRARDFGIAGGPVASLLIAGAMFTLWQMGWHSGLIAGAFYLSVVENLWALPPRVVRTADGTAHPTDLMILLHGWFGTPLRRSPGELLATYAHLLKLCDQLDAWQARILYILDQAIVQSALCDPEGAADTLHDMSLLDSRRKECARAEEAFARAFLAVSQRSNTEAAFAVAEKMCSDRPDLWLDLLLLKTAAALDLGRPAVALARDALETARGLRNRELVTEAEALLLEAEPPADPFAACQVILIRRGPGEAEPLVALRLCSQMADHLTQNGNTDQALSLAKRARELAAEIAEGIRARSTRQRFLERASKYRPEPEPEPPTALTPPTAEHTDGDQVDPDVEREPAPKKKKGENSYGRLGLTLWGGGVLFSFVFMLVPAIGVGGGVDSLWWNSGSDTPSYGIVFPLCFYAAGLVFSGMELFQKRRPKLHAVLGILFNGVSIWMWCWIARRMGA